MTPLSSSRFHAEIFFSRFDFKVNSSKKSGLYYSFVMHIDAYIGITYVYFYVFNISNQVKFQVK